MQVVETIEALRATVRRWREAQLSIALVPTMGNLHSGHLRLVGEAAKTCQRVVITIFVNPGQFGEDEDFAAYPRTLDADVQKLRTKQVNLLFVPSIEEVYPRFECATVEVPGLSNQLCGQYRPGHFAGVATVVCKLLNMVQPDFAIFGEKDFQQLLIIRRMVEDLNIPVRIKGIETVREHDGLALSSRNIYLSKAERRLAPLLYRTLCETKLRIEDSQLEFRGLENDQLAVLSDAGFVPDYFSIRRERDLVPAEPDDKELVILTAVRLGKTRLIDNLKVLFPEPH